MYVIGLWEEGERNPHRHKQDVVRVTLTWSPTWGEMTTHRQRVLFETCGFFYLIILNTLSFARTYTKHQTHAQSSIHTRNPFLYTFLRLLALTLTLLQRKRTFDTTAKDIVDKDSENTRTHTHSQKTKTKKTNQTKKDRYNNNTEKNTK